MIYILKNIGKGKIGVGERQITTDNLFRIDTEPTKDTNIYVRDLSFSNGIMSLNRTDGVTLSENFDGRYLRSFTELDPTVPQYVKNITLNNISNWNAGFYDDIISMNMENIAGTVKITLNQRSGNNLNDELYLGNLITNITQIANRSYNDLQNKPLLDIAGWNTALSWGDHSLEGYITGINNLTDIPFRSYNDLQDLPDINAVVNVVDTNTNLDKHEIGTVGSKPLRETVTRLNAPMLNGNILTIKFLNEDGIEQSVSVDLSTVSSSSSGINNATYNASTNIITLTEDDGDIWTIDLSEFSIIPNTDEFGVTTLTQEATIKLTISKVGQTGQFSDLIFKPTTIAGFGITNAYTKIEINSFLSGAIPATGYNKSNWDTAYNWGDHASVGYLTEYQNLSWDGGLGNISITNGNTLNLDGRYALYSQLKTLAFSGLTIKDVNDVEQFISTNHLRFDGVTFDAENQLITVEPVPPQTLIWNGAVRGEITISGGNTIDLDGRYSRNPLGREGEMYYITKDGTNTLEPDYPLKRGVIVETQEEFDTAVIEGFSLEEVFNRWEMFSHYFGSIEGEQSPPVFPAFNESDPQESTRLTAEEFYTKAAWGYDGVNERIYLTKNYTPYTGLISPKKYSNYTLEATLSSINNDDDQMGLIIGFHKDPISGFEYTLSVIRTLHQLSGQGTYSYVVAYNYGQNLTTSPDYDPTLASNSEQILVDSTSLAPVPGGATGWVGNDTRLRVERVNDVMAIKTSQFGSVVIDDATLITLDLTAYPELSVFMGSSEVGFSAKSQKDAYFSDIVFDGFVDYIFYNQNGGASYETWEFDQGTTLYNLQSPKTTFVSEYFGISRFAHSYLFSKVYYVTEDDLIIKIGGDFVSQVDFDAHTHTFDSLTNKPTTISGYGITDAFTKDESNTNYVNVTGDTMTGDLTSTAFIKNGGLPTEFLKADGTVDNNTYLTTIEPHFKYTVSTGIVSGGELTINAIDPATFDVGGGTGYIVNHIVNPPTVTELTWPGVTGQTLTNLATSFATDIGIDINGNVIQQNSFSPEELRSTILLGGLDHSNQTSIGSTFSIQKPMNAPASNLFELALALGDLNLAGNMYNGNTVGNLELEKNAGRVFSYGRNNVNNKNNPNIILTTSQAPVSFGYIFDDGAGNGVFTTPVTDIDPNNYDNGTGGLGSVPVNDWTVQRILLFPNDDKTFVQYGTQTFNKKEDVLNSIGRIAFPNLRGITTAMTRGYIIVRAGETDLTSGDTAFLNADKFGKVASFDGGSSLVSWGNITGLIDDQVDLNLRFDSKVNITGDTMTGNLTAPSFIRTGGAPTEFLKGDGSVDSSTYITGISVSDDNTNLDTHQIATVEGTILNETVTKLNIPTLSGNVLTLSFVNENDIIQTVNVDLSSIVTNESGINNASYDAASNVITLTETDGDVWTINLGEFSIIPNTDEFGITTLTQEGVIKLTVSKVGQTGQWADILGKPTTIAGFEITDAYTKTESNTNYVNVTGDTMTGNITAPSFIRTGGAPTEFLKGDGSVDTNLYPPLTNGIIPEQYLPDSPVLGVFGRTGQIVAQVTDYDAFYPKLSSSYINPSWITSMPWSKITNRPNTLAGYGITDSYTTTEIDNLFGIESPSTIVRTITINKLDLPSEDAESVRTYLLTEGITIEKGQVVLIKIETLPWYVSAIHINSFRKIVPTSTVSFRAHRLSDGAIMDIGWDGEYVDEASLLTFAQSGDVVVEFYNQINNQLDTRAPEGVISILPKVVIAGVVQKQNGFITSYHAYGSALRTDLSSKRPADSNVYNVLNNDSVLGAVMLLSCDSGKYDAWDAGSTSTILTDPNFPVGNLSRFKNGVPFTPTTRGDYYNNVNPLGHMLLEQHNFDFSLFNGAGEQFTGADWTYRYATGQYRDTAKYRTEMIIMDNSKGYDPAEVTNDIMTFYSLT